MYNNLVFSSVTINVNTEMLYTKHTFARLLVVYYFTNIFPYFFYCLLKTHHIAGRWFGQKQTGESEAALYRAPESSSFIRANENTDCKRLLTFSDYRCVILTASRRRG